MKPENGYLSDEQLKQLILQVETEDLIFAPPDLKENILNAVQTKNKDSKKEYRQYCFRVLFSAAAAITLVFLFPKIKTLSVLEEVKEWKMQKDYEAYEEVPTREEVLGETKQFSITKWRFEL